MSALRIDKTSYSDEVKGIVEMIRRQVEYWKIEQQFDWMKKEYPKKFENNIRYRTMIWSKDEMEITMHKIEEELQ